MDVPLDKLIEQETLYLGMLASTLKTDSAWYLTAPACPDWGDANRALRLRDTGQGPEAAAQEVVGHLRSLGMRVVVDVDAEDVEAFGRVAEVDLLHLRHRLLVGLGPARPEEDQCHASRRRAGGAIANVERARRSRGGCGRLRCCRGGAGRVPAARESDDEEEGELTHASSRYAAVPAPLPGKI